VLLFQKRFHDGLKQGAITLTFRHWEKPRVKPLGRYRVHPIGVVECRGLSQVKVADISEDDAQSAGFLSRAELLDYMRGVRPELSESDDVWRVELAYGGDGDRVQIATDATLTDDDVLALQTRLKRLDAHRRPWTRKTLALIESNPRVAASQLALKLGREKLAFKADVVKLKKLGLTQSFEVGYEVSPRGRAFLSREAALAGSRVPSAKQPRNEGKPSRGRGRRAGDAPSSRPGRRSGRAGATSRGTR
jgi:hypothetical protein